MKRLLSIVLIFAMIFSMASCGKKYTAADVVKMIDDIGEVTIDSRKAIDAAEEAYNSLSEDEQLKVTNHIKFLTIQHAFVAVSSEEEVRKLIEEEKYNAALKVIDGVSFRDSAYLTKMYSILKASVNPQTMRAPGDIPLSYEFVSNDSDAEVYKVALDSSYKAAEDDKFVVWYGKQNSQATVPVSEVLSVEEISGGVEVCVLYALTHELDKENAAGVLRIERYSGAAEVAAIEQKIRGTGEKHFAANSNPVSGNTIKSSTFAAGPDDRAEYAAIAKACGLSEDLSIIENPKTNADYLNNLFYRFLRGQYKIVYSNPIDPDWMFDAFIVTADDLGWKYDDHNIALRSDTLSCSKTVLLGHFMNQAPTFYAKDGEFFVYLWPGTSIYSESEIARQIKEACKTGYAMYDEMVSKGLLKSGDSQLKKAKAIADYLDGLGVTFYSGLESDNRGACMAGDTAYACLVNRRGACGSKASAMELMLNIAGIKAYGIGCGDNGGGHIITYFVADGKEYWCDWGNYGGSKGLTTIDDFDTLMLYPRAANLKLDRMFAGQIEEKTLDDLIALSNTAKVLKQALPSPEAQVATLNVDKIMQKMQDNPNGIKFTIKFNHSSRWMEWYEFNIDPSFEGIDDDYYSVDLMYNGRCVNGGRDLLSNWKYAKEQMLAVTKKFIKDIPNPDDFYIEIRHVGASLK